MDRKGTIVVKIGGSLLFTKDKKINLQKISDFCDIIKNKPDFDTLIIVCGGGLLAREYIESIRSLKGNEALCDIIGIEISRLNSKLFITSFGVLAYPQVPKSIEELSIATLFKKIIIMGGLQPGQSTTSVALEVAEYSGAKELILLTNVKGIYDKDPKKHKDAKLFQNISYEELQNIILRSSDDKQAAAGEYRIFDAVSLQILKRSHMNILVMSGSDLNNFENYWNGTAKFMGTIISPTGKGN
ncbi:MAG: UMP kinase [Promethearchaeota archaeon]